MSLTHLEIGKWRDGLPGKKASPKQRALQTLGITTVAIGVGLVAYGLSDIDALPHYLLSGLFCILVPLSLSLRGMGRATEYQTRFLEEEAADIDDLVTISIFQEGVLTGTDHGMMTIIDGALVFVGERCDFTLGPQDLSRYHPTKDDSAWLKGNGTRAFELRQLNRKVVLGIRPLAANTKLYDSSPLMRELDILPNTFPSPVTSLYPPLSKQKEIPTRNPLRDLLIFFMFSVLAELLSAFAGRLFALLKFALLFMVVAIANCLRDIPKDVRERKLFRQLADEEAASLPTSISALDSIGEHRINTLRQ